MRRRRKFLYSIICLIFMGIYLLDIDTVIEGAQYGIELCLKSIIPSLFPFIFLSTIINQLLTGEKLHTLSKLNKLCAIPDGCESILLLGLLGGYPIGAKMIADTYNKGLINKQTAARLLGFCNNAGPAFILGILSSQFTSKAVVFLIWVIHIISALLTGVVLPGRKDITCQLTENRNFSIPQFLQSSIYAISSVCGWIILFRIIITFLHMWLGKDFSNLSQVILSGLLELSNGCISLYLISEESVRFIVAAIMLGAGGLCITMQTISVVGKLGLGLYIPGKILQISFSLILTLLLHPFLFSIHLGFCSIAVGCVGSMCVIVGILFYMRRKTSSIPEGNVV